MQTTPRGILALLFIIFILATTTAMASVAQTALQVEQLRVDLWPEYDRVDMLVIYRGTLPADTPLPATLTLRLPARVSAPHAVAYRDENGSLYTADHSSASTDDYLEISLKTPTRNFQLEFYDRLDRAGDQRSYTFVWPGDYAVGELGILFMPPSDAREIHSEPALPLVQQETDLTSYGGTLSSLAAGQQAEVFFSYQGGPINVGERPALPTNGGHDNTLRFVGAATLALLLVILSRMWYTRRPAPHTTKASIPRQRPKRPKGQQRRQKHKQAPAANAAGKNNLKTAPSPATYCTHCGRPLHEGDRFCGHCGTDVKTN